MIRNMMMDFFMD